MRMHRNFTDDNNSARDRWNEGKRTGKTYVCVCVTKIKHNWNLKNDLLF